MARSADSRRRRIDILTDGEIARLMTCAGTKSVRGTRICACMAILWRGQLRITELLTLRVDDIDLDACTIRVQHGKRDRFRTVGVDPMTIAMVRQWLAKRPRFAKADSPLFCTSRGTPLRRNSVADTLKRLATKAGITKRVHAHGFRHKGACELAAEGVPTEIIRRQLGHSNLQTTTEYLRGISAQDVIDAMRNRVVPYETWAACGMTPPPSVEKINGFSRYEGIG
jgi:integrase/recombinase XerD